MADLDFLKTIKETEGVADEIIFNARVSVKEQIDIARNKANEIKENAKKQAVIDHKSVVDKAKIKSNKHSEERNIKAKMQANDAIEKTKPNKKNAVKVIREGIVESFVNS